MPLVTRTQSLLELQVASTDRVLFSNIDDTLLAGADGDPRSWKSVSISHELWSDFGEPERITLTIEPNDILNVPQEG